MRGNVVLKKRTWYDDHETSALYSKVMVSTGVRMLHSNKET